MIESLLQTINKNNEFSETINAANIIVHYLEQLELEYVFGVPGGTIEPIYNALAHSERRGKVRSVNACQPYKVTIS